uniref:Lipoprotein n=1 Tax=Heterorhabditis bacteriophora TaxID=37862 RepID=A0A1I7XQ11_HETBA
MLADTQGNCQNHTPNAPWQPIYTISQNTAEPIPPPIPPQPARNYDYLPSCPDALY